MFQIWWYKMLKNNKAGGSKSKRPSTSFVQTPAGKSFHAGDPFIEQKESELLLTSVQSHKRQNYEDFFLYWSRN